MTDYDEMDYLENEWPWEEPEPEEPSPRTLVRASLWANTLDDYLGFLMEGYHAVHLRYGLEKHLKDVLEDEWFFQWPLIRLAYASQLLEEAVKQKKPSQKKIKKALEILLPLADKKYPGALLDVGECYFNGWGMEQSYPKAIDCWVKGSLMGFGGAEDRLKRSFFADNKRRYMELPMRLRLIYLYEAIRLYMEHYYATAETFVDKLDSGERRKVQQACREIIRCEQGLPRQQYLRDAARLFLDDDENPYKLDV